jgi:hypothetical protein
MCNPNSSIVNRRRRQLALVSQMKAAALKSPSVLTQNLFSSRVRDDPGVSHGTDYTHRPTALEKVRSTTSSSNSSTESSISTTLSPHRPFQQDHFGTPEVTTPKPKRRRKPQKPGKTAKQNDRHFVVHNYHDHANDEDEPDSEKGGGEQRRRGGVTVSFPLKLHAVLDQVETDGLAHVVSWQHHGRCFVIHKPKDFTEHIMPNYFRQTKLTSFQRQLNLYGFNRLTKGNDSGGYYHDLFLRGKPFLCKRMERTKVKGTKFKAASSPDEEPNFYCMVGFSYDSPKGTSI